MLKIEYIPKDELKTYANNAKLHTAEQVEQIKRSIEQFGFNDPIAVWKDNEIIEGHGRLLAAMELDIEDVPVIRLDNLTDEQRRAYMLAHNKVNMNTDFDLDLLEIELDNITEFDMSEFGFDLDDDVFDSYDKPEIKRSLTDKFIVPPFSVLDTKQGYWQDRKRLWLEKTGNLSESRDGEFGRVTESPLFTSINGGTSNFDPVLAEVMYKWFNVDGGHILDPFGGEQTKGVVAGECGYKYTAVEFRQEQVDINNDYTMKYDGIKYVCGDSNNISELIPERGFDMCFTSPPYYDLEVYSKEDMSALGTYEEFMAQYANIFKQCFDMLADDRFLVVKVGEIRDKKTGIYRNFVGDTISVMRDIGFKYYNEIILVNTAGTLPIRASQTMNTRKVGKMHQNILVFFKGNPKNIKAKFPALDFEGMEEDE